MTTIARVGHEPSHRKDVFPFVKSSHYRNGPQQVHQNSWCKMEWHRQLFGIIMERYPLGV